MTEEEKDAQFAAEMADRYSLPKVMLRAEYSDAADALVLVAEIRRLQKLVEELPEYEYAVEWTRKDSDVPFPILDERWVPKGSALRMIEFNERMFPDKMEKYSVRLVKRRKAGGVEDV